MATGTYRNGRIPDLAGPAVDAQRLMQVLGNPSVGAFRVTALVDRPAREIAEALELFLGNLASDDMALIHFSCHGGTDRDGQLYFAATDTNPDSIRSTAVSAAFLNDLAQKSPAERVVLLLDCCYSGAFGKATNTRDLDAADPAKHFTGPGLDGGRGVVVISASSADQVAFEGSTRGAPSVFTGALADGLDSGDADTYGNGVIKARDLYEYLHRTVSRTHSNQVPRTWGFGIEGDLVIAKSGRRRTEPAPLPPASGDPGTAESLPRTP